MGQPIIDLLFWRCAFAAATLPRPRITAHRSVLERFSRYDATHRLNSVVMGRQFNMPGYALPDQHHAC